LNNFGEKVSFIWWVADLMRGPYRPNQYKDVVVPVTIMRRLDCVLEPTKEDVHAKLKSLNGEKVKNVEPVLCRTTGVPFFNTSRYTFEKLKGAPNNIAAKRR
jgi:type I restriction enzyme M protein